MSRENIRKTCSIAILLAIMLAALPLAVRAQQAYPPGDWKFRIVDDWDKWGKTVPSQANPVTEQFGAVAYLYNSTPPINYVGPTWSFESWKLISQGEADENGWVTIPGLPGDASDRCIIPGREINYTLIVKLKIGKTVTPITIFNATVLRVGYKAAPAEAVGLYDLLNATAVSNWLYGVNYYKRGSLEKDWVWSDRQADWAESSGGKYYARYRMWLYYIAIQALDELGFPVTGATLEVRYNSSYDSLGDKTYITNKRVAGWNNKLYGVWKTNGSLGEEFIKDPGSMYRANYEVGWVILRVPLINQTTAPDLTYRSSLVSNLTFIWRFKTGTVVGVEEYYVLDPEYGPIPKAWYTDYWMAGWLFDDYLMPGVIGVNTTHFFNLNLKWTQVSLLDCNYNPWWTMKAEVSGFDVAGKNEYPLVGARAGPGQYMLRYPLPVPPFKNTTISLSVEWYYSLVNHSDYVVGYTYDPDTGEFIDWYDELQINQVYDQLWDGYLLDSPDAFLDADKVTTLVCNMTFVGVNFWSEAELPQTPPDFAAKIWLPSTIAYRKAEPLTVWWNGKNGFVVLPDMEWYAGPNPMPIHQMDPYGVAQAIPVTPFTVFYTAMTQYPPTVITPIIPGYIIGNGWLPTMDVGWVDFEAWYEGMKVLDTYADGNSLKLPCCRQSLPPGTICLYNLTLKIYEIGWHIILESCGTPMDQDLLTGIPFFFKHPSPDISEYGMIGPKGVNKGKVDVVKAPYGNYSNFAIVWEMSLLRPNKIMYLFDNGTSKEIKEPILLDKNMRNIQLYFNLWNLTVKPVSQEPFTLVKVNVTVFSKSDFGIAPGIGISKRQLDIITDPNTIYYKHVLPPGWVKYKTEKDEYGYPVVYYHTDVQTVFWNYAYRPHPRIQFPSWHHLPEKEYWIRVFVPEDPLKAKNAGFRAVDANATLYWSGDPWNEPLYLKECYGQDDPLELKTYVYDPKVALKTACGEPLVFSEDDQSALIVAEPWYSDAEYYNLFCRQQIDPEASVLTGTPKGVIYAPYNSYLVRKNETDSNGVVELHSVNATNVNPPDDPDLWNPTTGRVAKVYPNQSRYFIGYSAGTPPTVLESSPKYRFMVYYKGVLVFNHSIALTNPYVSKQHVLTTSVYPYRFMPVNTPLPGEDPRFAIPGVKVKVFWAGLNLTWWPTQHLAFEYAPIEFSLLNASKLTKGFNMSVVKRLWGPRPIITVPLELMPYTPAPPYFSSMVWTEEAVTDSDGKAVFLIPVWNYSYTPNIFTWITSDGSTDGNLVEYEGGPINPWTKLYGPMAINLLKAGDTGRLHYIFGTPVYAEFWTIPGTTVNIPPSDVPRPLGYLEDMKYCRWIQYSMNATGLVNSAHDVWKKTGCISVNTTYRAEYMSKWYGGIGMLSKGAYQGRTPDRETGTTVAQGEDGCYAKAEQKVPANDIRVVVRNLDKVGLPNQKVTVVREAVYKWVVDGDERYYPFEKDGKKAEKVLVESKRVWLVDWTPTIQNADPPDFYKLELRSTKNVILWGIYDVTVKTENLTRGMDNVKLRLNDPQFVAYPLLGGVKDWTSGTVYLDWPARLRVTILTEDGRPLEKAWVYVVDAYSRGNVTAAFTDEYGHAGTLVVGKDKAVPPLRIEPGDRVDIGFNLLRGWYWVNESRMLSGIAVNPNWGVGYDKPTQPIGEEYVQRLDYQDNYWGWTPTMGSGGIPISWLGSKYYMMYDGWARFYGKYYVVVYYKPGGCDRVLGPVFSEVVFDSYNDEAHHQFIYLGIRPEAYAAVSDYGASQAPKYRAYVNDLRITFKDSVGRELTNVEVVAKRPEYKWVINLGKVETGTAVLSKVPLRPGTSYAIDAKWTSKYGGKQAEVKNYPVKDLESVVVMPVYDVTLRLVTRKGTILPVVDVKVEGVDVGTTSGLTGEVLVTQIPSGSYSVTAKWLETDLALPSLTVTASGVVTLTPTNVFTLTVRVLGAQGQALEGATVRVTKGAVEITRLTDKDGKAEIELPGAGYNIEVTYGNFKASDTVTLNADTIKTLSLDVFLEVFGVGMTMAQFLLFIVMIIIIVIVLAIVIHEYHIYRRKKLPQLFGAPAAPK